MKYIFFKMKCRLFLFHSLFESMGVLAAYKHFLAIQHFYIKSAVDGRTY